MSEIRRGAYGQAIEDFRRARSRATLETLLDRLQGQPVALMSFEEVQKKLHAQIASAPVLKEIPVDAIVGSVGRYEDFTRTFLPREEADQHRWAAVKALSEGTTGLPPIEVYQVGDAYFVRDGHHRVSVARDMGSPTIEAYVVETSQRVSLGPDDDPTDLILKAEQTDFLERTGLDQLRPSADIELTEVGRYPQLEKQIEVHRYYMGLEEEREIKVPEAVADWYDQVYLPLVLAIRQRGVLRDFPGRTEADVYLWVADHREQLRDWLGWYVEADQAAEDLLVRHSPRPSRVADRVGERLLDSVIPEELEPGPPAGDWRRQVVDRRQDDRLFRDILVPLRGDEAGWQALEQAIVVAQRESARLLGLHIVGEDSEPAPYDGMRERFEQRCQQAHVEGQLIVQAGSVAVTLPDRARWVDLVVLQLAHPPADQMVARLSSGIRRLIRGCPRPLLVVPGAAEPLNRGVLAFDGSAKAREALFIATYMASAWGIALSVVTFEEKRLDADQVLTEARSYLEGHSVEASYHRAPMRLTDGLLAFAAEENRDLILIGGYGATPVVEAVAGSGLDEILRRLDRPLLVSR
ncbi:MAG: universal stress protein [Anaerolineales bacterium]